jgi:KaiC/GvpD/RAD55 family RecA-like ATPase
MLPPDEEPTIFGSRRSGSGEKVKRRTAPNGQAKGFTLTRLRLVEFDTAPPCIVEGLIPREGLTLVWGPPKCGKTFWCFDLVAHIALGRSYCGREVEQGPVVYIACEGEHGVRTRAVAFRQARMSEGEDPPFYLMTTRLDLVIEIEALIEAVHAQLAHEDRGAVVIVIDTLNRSLHGSESKDEDMSAYVQAADRLRDEFRCSVILIHHCGVAGDRPRGHTSLTGAIDVQIAVQKDADGTVLATLELMKDGPEGAMLRCRLEPVDVGVDDHDKPITSCVVEHLGMAAAGEKAARPHRLPAAQKLALNMLHEAIVRGGELPPASTHIPVDKRCITEELWRQYCYQGGISAGDSQDAKRKAFNRALEALLADDRIGSWDGWFWPI